MIVKAIIIALCCLIGMLIILVIHFYSKLIDIQLEFRVKEQAYLDRNVKLKLDHEQKIITLETKSKQEITAARKDSLDKSRSVMRGQVSEQLAPLLLTNFNLKDFKFIGQPIDYIIFSGASDISDNISNEINEIVFLEIKTGNASMTKVQRRIKDAIINNKVRFVTYNPDTKTTKDYSEDV